MDFAGVAKQALQANRAGGPESLMEGGPNPFQKWKGSVGRSSSRHRQQRPKLENLADLFLQVGEEERNERRNHQGEGNFFKQYNDITKNASNAAKKWRTSAAAKMQAAAPVRKATMSLSTQESPLREEPSAAYISVLQAILGRAIDPEEDPGLKDTLIAHAREAFQIDDDSEHDAFMTQASVSPNVYDTRSRLLLHVNSARKLGSCLSPFCVIKLLRRSDKKLQRQVLSHEYQTHEAEAGPSPEWLEQFEFSVRDMRTASLKLEFYDRRVAIAEDPAFKKTQSSPTLSGGKARRTARLFGRRPKKGNRRLGAGLKRISRPISRMFDSSKSEVLLGSATVDLSALEPGSTVVDTVWLTGKTEGAQCEIQLTTDPILDEAQTAALARSRHRMIQHMLWRLSYNLCAKETPDQLWQGSLHPTSRVLLDLTAAHLRIAPEQQLVDAWCTVMDIHDKHSISFRAMLAVLEPLVTRLASDGAVPLDRAHDEGRFVAALESAATSCHDCLGQLLTCFAGHDESVARDEARCMVQLLVHVYGTPAWQRATAMRADLVQESGGETKPLDLAQKMLEEDPNSTYIMLKHEIIRQCGATAFESCKQQISSMIVRCQQQEGLAAPEDGSSDPLMQRLEDLLNSQVTVDITYTGIKKVLTREFGTKLFEKNKQLVSARLIQEMNARRHHIIKDGTVKHKRDLLTDIKPALEEYAGRRYLALAKASEPDTEFEGADIVKMVKTTFAVEADLEQIGKVFQQAFVPIGLDVFTQFVSWLDKCLSADLRTSLYAWRPSALSLGDNSGAALPVVIFELYFAAKHLVDLVSKKVDEAVAAELRLPSYTTWFEPFVVYWMASSKSNGCKWIQSSIDEDEFVPVRDDDLYSSSCLDVFTALYEILDFWDKLAWPDKEAAEEFLFDKLVDAVCCCVVFFTEQLRAQASAIISRPQDGAFHISEALCVVLNNLDHAGYKLNDIYEYMRVEDVAESHLAKARTLNLGHGGVVKQHPAVKRFDQAFEAMAKNIRGVVEALVAGVKPPTKRLFDECIARADVVNSGDLTHDFVFKATSTLLRDEDEASLEAADGQESAREAGYLHRNLAAVVRFVQDEDTLQTVVMSAWQVVCGCMSEAVLRKIGKSTRMAEYQFLLLVHHQLKMFFMADGEGLTFEQLNVRENKRLEILLALANLPVDDVVTFYYEQASLLQATHLRDGILRTGYAIPERRERTGVGVCDPAGDQPFTGRLTLDVQVKGGSKETTVLVKIVSASELPLIKGSQPDALVRVELQPRNVVEGPKIWTDIAKHQSDPTWNQLIELKTTEDLKRVVLQCVVACRRRRTREVIGEVYLDLYYLQSLPTAVSVTVPLVRIDKQPLFRDIRELVRFRKSESRVAQYFLKKRDRKYLMLGPSGHPL